MSPTSRRPDDAGAPTTSKSPESDLEARLDRLEQRMDALIGRLENADTPAQQPADLADTGPDVARPEETLPDAFWALNSLKERLPRPGGVVYTGAVDVGVGHVEYQWGRPTDPLLRADWAERAERVAALGHPLRLSILRHLLDGERTVAQLVDELDLASTGVAYHHLNQLQNAGWVTTPQRGLWTVVPAKIVPLLAIITALEDS